MSMMHIFAAPLLATLVLQAYGSEFLRSRSEGVMQEVTRDVIEQTLLSELLTNSDQLVMLEGELKSMYTALPKSQLGTLEPSTVRYALHRYFVQKHGWYVRGLEPAGQAWNSSATSVMADRVPAYIEGLFAQRLHGEGLGLHELAVFVAALTDFVHKEALSNVVDIYQGLKLPFTGVLSAWEQEQVIQAYVLQFLRGSLTFRSAKDVAVAAKEMKVDFPAWPDFQIWVSDVRKALSYVRSKTSFQKSEATFENVVGEVQELNHRIGAFQNIECGQLKAVLAESEEGATGRVPLAEFYSIGLEGDWLFKEKIEYLRSLGAMDERDPARPSVIIPNYIASQANCLASSGFHSVCCIDECEGLMSHVECAIGAPIASVGRVAEVVGGLRSDTVDAPRNLSSALLSRLSQISDLHDGQIPLHGRLFAQWMHHAYPLECPYPRIAGTVPLTPDEWMDKTGNNDVSATEKERIRVSALTPPLTPEMKLDTLPWIGVEQLVASHNHVLVDSSQRKGTMRGTMRQVVAVIALAAFAFPLVKLSKAAFMPLTPQFEKQHMV